MKVCSRLYVACFRWLALLAMLVLTAWACVSHPLGQPTPDPVIVTTGKVVVVASRKLDLLFMVDNSPSMGPKQAKMADQFPGLIEALRDPVDQTLPDLRVAIIDSDLGSGDSGKCKKSGRYGDMGQFQMRDAASCGAKADVRWLEFEKGKAVNFDEQRGMPEVFKCLATKVGVEGCGYEHQLGAINWAFNLVDNKSQREFLRDDAFLGVVILTDEDDCSATMHATLFNPNDTSDSTSLRCATRGHSCEGVTLTEPTKAPVSVPYESCHARTDATCEDGQDGPDATCNPLLNIKSLAANLKALKGDGGDKRILVAGIYGTPRKDDKSAKKYVIDTATPQGSLVPVYDYWPICYDPAFMPSGSGYDMTAAEHGATGGLRISAFLNEFDADHSLSYSICESTFGPAMEGIGKQLRTIMKDLCVPFKVVDTSKDPGIQADCRVAYMRPTLDEKGNRVLKEDKAAIPKCDASRTNGCWELKLGNESGTADERDTAQRCRATATTPSQLINVVPKPGDILDEGTQVVMYCLSCVDLPPGLPPKEGCEY
jgi:hypothetical protein